VDPEAGVAQLLASTLHDEALWAWVESPDDLAREALARRAVKLYQRTWPLIDASRDGDPQPIHYALAVIRDIAATAATSSYPWTEAQRDEFGVKVATRALIELAIRLYDVDDWAAELGYPLGLHDSGIPEEAWLDQPEPIEDYEATVAAQVCELLRLYGGVLDVGDAPEVRDALSGAEQRRAYAALVNVARGMMVYARSRLPAEAQPALIGYVYVADALFVASRNGTDVSDLFPSKEYLRWLLHPDGRDWLLSQGGELPDWLT
jgi:hypothetical protein